MNDCLKEKVHSAFCEPFVGNMVFSNDEMEELYSYVNHVLRQFINTRGSTLSSMFDEYMFVAMVNACKEWNSEEETFFGYIYRKLLGSDEGTQKVYNYITEMLSRLSSGKNSIFYLDCYKKKYYATTIGHALAPKQSTDSFFELCWQIYCNDMDQSFFHNDPIFKLLASQLHSKFLGNEDEEKDIQFGSVVYSFRAGIKGVAIKYPEKMETLLRNTIELIHKLFNGESIEHNKYLNLLAEKWWKNKEETLGIQKNKRTEAKEKIVSDYSSITCKYCLTDQIELTIPAFRLLSNMDQNPQLDIFCGDELVYSKSIDTKGSGIIMSAKASSISINDIVLQTENLELRVVINHAGKVIYDSQKTLYRTFVLFKNDREIFAQDCQPGNYSLYTISMEQFCQYPNAINYLGNCIYTLSVEDGEVLQTEKQTIFFASEKKRHDIWIKADKCSDVSFVLGQEEFSVVNGDLFIQVEKEINARDYGVRYGDVVFNLTDFECEDKGNYLSYPITSIVNVGEPQSISVFKYSDGKIVAMLNIIKFKNINITYDKTFYYDTVDIGTVVFKTDKYNETTTFSIDDEDVTIKFNGGILRFYPPILSWRIDNGKWNSRFIEKPIWYETITNSSIIEFKLPSGIVGKLLLTNNRVVEECGKTGNAFKIGQTIHSLVGGSYSRKEVTVVYRFDECVSGDEHGTLIPIACFGLKEKLISLPLVLSNQRLLWQPSEQYVGSEKSLFELTISDNNGTENKLELDLTPKMVNIEPIEDGYYQVSVNLIKKGFITTKEELWRETVCVGDEREFRFKHKAIKVSNVMLYGANSATMIKTFYVGSLHFLCEQDGSVFYSGSVYVIDRYGKKIYLNTMPNDYGAFEKINPVRLEMRTARSFWMVWGLNKEDVSDFQSQFTLNNDNKICNSDKYVRGIDFYFIDKVDEE